MLPPVLLCIDDRPQLLQLRKSSLEPLGYSVISPRKLTSLDGLNARAASPAARGLYRSAA
jgi:hypothetical protein